MNSKSERRTVTVEQAGRILGIGRSSAFEACRRGEIPTLRIGKRLLVPIAALEKMLSGVGDDRPGELDDANIRPRDPDSLRVVRIPPT